MGDTQAVHIEVLQVRPETPPRGTSLVAHAQVRLEIAGVALVLDGVPVSRMRDGRLLAGLPHFPSASRGWCPTIQVPQTLARAIRAEVEAAAEAELAS